MHIARSTVMGIVGAQLMRLSLCLVCLSILSSLPAVESHESVGSIELIDDSGEPVAAPITAPLGLHHDAQPLRLHAPLTTSLLAEGGLPIDARVIQAQIFVPENAPTDLGVGAFIKDDDGTWFQLAFAERLTAGHHHVHFPLDTATQWSSEPSTMRWSDYRIFNGQEYGLYFWSEQSSTAEISILSLRAVTALHHTAQDRAYTCTDFEIAHYDEEKRQVQIQTGERWDVQVRPDPFPQNPYDMELFQMDLVVTDAGDKELRFPCFYKQQMLLHDGGDREVAVPTMNAFYCARFRPKQAGDYAIRIEARWYLPKQELKSETEPEPEIIERILQLGTLKVSGDDFDPYLRVDETDKRFFSYGAGEKQFHFPVGLNIQCISDKRAIKNVKSGPTPVRGLLSYKAYLDRLARGGANSAEIWLSSWNLALEWNDKWPDQHGVGIYSEANAERVEQLLDYAWERGIRVILVINNHGQASAKSDPEWKQSPYNKVNGGWLDKPGQMFTDERARHYQQQIRRYIVGRYADHPAIMCWKMWSEMNLTGGSKKQLVDWHAWAFNDWKAMDHYYQHPVTSHWCGDYRNPDPKLVSLPQMDFIAIDAYHRQGFLPGLLQRSTLDPKRGLSKFEKPIVVTEFGGNWNACPLPQLIAEHHIGAWCALVNGHGSAPHLWWFEWVDQNDLYRPFGGITKFLAGEDLRDPQARSVELSITQEAKAIAGNKIWNRAWLHNNQQSANQITAYFVDHQWANDGLQTPLHSGLRCTLHLKAGRYAIEWWDASMGQCIATETLTANDKETSSVLIPDFRRHLALKVRSMDAEANEKDPPKLGALGN